MERMNKLKRKNKQEKTFLDIAPPCDESAAQSKLKILTNK